MQFTKNSLAFPRQNIIFLPVTESTNTYAKNLLSNFRPVSDGTVILAEEQTAGRGQKQSSWHSEKGLNLTISIINECSFLIPSKQFILSIAASLAVKDFLENEGIPQIYIKWPNDIYSGNKKLAGILIENIIQGSALKFSITGIGLNVNQVDFPGLPTASSLKKITGKFYSIPESLEMLMYFFGLRWMQLKSGNEEVLKKDYHNALLGLNTALSFVAQNQIFQGIIRGVGESGELIIENNGKLSSFWNKEIEFNFRD